MPSAAPLLSRRAAGASIATAVCALALLPVSADAAMTGTCRVDAATLTPAERADFVSAVQAVMSEGDYLPFVDQHDGAMLAGHFGPAFLPWHREFLRRFEQRLREENPNISLPYWDWSSSNAEGGQSLIWRDDFMGPPGTTGTGALASGPFSSWGILRRDFDPLAAPAQAWRDAQLLDMADYGSFAAGLEISPHNATHDWIGGVDLDGFGLEGTMATMRSPNDPIFWLLHANVDRLWAEWDDRHQYDAGFDPYPFTSGQTIGHNRDDTMWPWNGSGNSQGGPTEPWVSSPENVRPADLLDHRALGSFYDTIDTECGGTPTPPPPPPPPPTEPPVEPQYDPPTVRPVPRAVRFALSRRPSRGTTTRMLVRGLIVPAAGQPCGGAILVRAYVGKRRFAATKVRLRRVGSRCRFVAQVRTRRAGRARVVRATVRFMGTSKMRPRGTRAKALRVIPPPRRTS